MAYFNYFIKCVIRNIAYKLCKPKVFFTVLLSVVILFVLHTKGYCAEWTDGEIEAVLDGLATITSNQGTVISQLSSMGLDVDTIQKDLDSVKLSLNSINNNTSNINLNLIDLVDKVIAINTTLTQLAEQQNIQYNNIYQELQMIRDSLNGSDVENSDFTNGSVSSSTNNIVEKLKLVTIDYENGYSYTVKLTYNNPFGGNMNILNYSSNNSLSNGYVFNNYDFKGVASVPANSSSFIVEYSVPSTHPAYLYFTWGDYVTNIVVERQISGLTSSIDKNNDLQQEQNQLQQEQNDFLKNDSVDVDSSTLPSDTTQDITDSGFNNIFQTLYNTFTSGTAQDLVINVPFTSKSFVINAKNVYGNADLGLVKTLIQTFWYFIVSYFIVQDIGKKINKIKSGNIENIQEDNIKEDML